MYISIVAFHIQVLCLSARQTNMWTHHNQQTQYLPITNFESDGEGELGIADKHAQSTSSRFFMFVSIILACSIGFIGGFTWGSPRKISSVHQDYQANLFSPQCTNPSTRREWRSLSLSEKRSYIRAVKCLTEKPTQLRADGVLYDDFPYTHSKIGNYSKSFCSIPVPAFAWREDDPCLMCKHD